MASYLHSIRRHIGHQKIPLIFASACVLDDKGNMLWQHRADFDWWGLPGGILELEESLPECVAREVFEESGLEVEPKHLIGVYSSPDFDVIYPNNDHVQQVTACFECRIKGGRLRIDNNETLNLAWLPIDKPPPTSLWYMAMSNDLLLNLKSPCFDRGSPGKRENDKPFFETIRHKIEDTPLIVPFATAFIQDEEERVLLWKCDTSDKWELPGGYMELGERIDQTVINEVRKKTGLIIKPMKLIGICSDYNQLTTSPHGSSFKPISFIFKCKIISGKVETDTIEPAKMRFFSHNATPCLSMLHKLQLQIILIQKKS